IIETLKKYTGMPRSVEKAAKELGISRATMYRKLKKIRERN
ncbi:MAG: helix-turn-helix domain-containing protein, partial [Thermoanaerobacteraceae bacterium]|nr:helix-turn-helix domain-containing protein [Thermoanaerobacteraceae bacterium]